MVVQSLEITKGREDLQAVALDGLDLTSFVLGPAIEKARKVLNEHANIALAKQGLGAVTQFDGSTFT